MTWLDKIEACANTYWQSTNPQTILMETMFRKSNGQLRLLIPIVRAVEEHFTLSEKLGEARISCNQIDPELSTLIDQYGQSFTNMRDALSFAIEHSADGSDISDHQYDEQQVAEIATAIRKVAKHPWPAERGDEMVDAVPCTSGWKAVARWLIDRDRISIQPYIDSYDGLLEKISALQVNSREQN